MLRRNTQTESPRLHISGVTIKITSQILMKADTLYPDNEHEETHRSTVSDFHGWYFYVSNMSVINVSMKNGVR